MRHIYSTCFLTAIVFLASVSVSAQETQERVVDEVVEPVDEHEYVHGAGSLLGG